MENSEKVEEGDPKTIADVEQPGDSTQKEPISGDAEVIDDKKFVDNTESEVEPKAIEIVIEVNNACEEKTPQIVVAPKSDLTKSSEEKPQEIVLPVLEKEEEDKLPQPIEECDAGGDEISNLSVVVNVPEPTAEVQVPEIVTISQSLEREPILLAELTTVASEELLVPVADPRSDVVAIDDDDEDDDNDDDDDDDVDDEDDEDDEDADDDDDDDDEISNEALNADELDLYDDEEKMRKRSSLTRELLPSHPIDDFDDDYDDDDDDEDMEDAKDDSNLAVVIGSSDDDDDQKAQTPRPTAPLQKPQQAAPARKYEDIDDDLDYEDDDDDDDDDDDYDDDDLMNAVVTSASKSLSSSPVKKRPRSESRSPSPNVARRKEADQITVLTRRINYGRIAKKKSLNWLYSKKKREAYKSILPRRRPSTTAVAMRSSNQSGGLLHLKISPPSVTSIVQRPLIKSSASTPIISRIESRTSAPATPQKEEYVIDLDSSPEKSIEKATPRNQADDRQHLETGVKKPPDNQEETDNKSHTMQQTDKVRDSIQKSTEEVEEIKSVARLTCEQNKENLQSNEALKKEKDELTTKHEAESKETAPAEDAMDTIEEPSESTLKADEFTISSVTSLNLDIIKEEKLDHTPIPPPTAEVASKVTLEDVQEKEIPRLVVSPPPPQVVGATKRRRSSSTTQERSKLPKSTAPEQDDDEEYVHPTKKLREELQSNYPTHDRILTEYIEKTSNDSIDTIQRHIEQMLSEIQTLNDMIKAKEVEWNNMLHLKKVKEEICFRLTRRKQCMEIMATKVGETGHPAGLDEDYLGNDSLLALGKTPPPQQQQHPQLSSTPIAAAINSLSSNICNFTAVSSSSSAAPTTAQLIIQNRANMKSSDLVKEKANTQRLHRNILPKPNTTSAPASTSSPIMAASLNNQQPNSSSTNGPLTRSSSNQPILNSYLTSADSVQQLVDMMNGHHNNHSGLQNGGAANNSQAAMVGRQGPFKDVRSIIADFRQQHPEAVPRRGRRVKNSNTSNLSDSNTILANALKSDTNSRPSSNDSSSHSLSNANQSTTNHNNVNSFKDVLAPFAKSQAAASLRSAGGQQPPYPEVTLHPVSTPVTASGGQDQPTGSLLHGILTKFSRPNESANSKAVANQTSANYISNFSPTLARLLTAPERISAGGAGGPMGNQLHNSSASGVGGSDGGGNNSGNAHHSMPGFGVNLSKVVGHNSEITITPVMNSMHQQSVLQHQLQQQQLKDVLTRAAAAVSGNTVKEEHFHKLSSFAAASAANDDDAEDSVDRLVIDEGVDSIVGGEDHQRIAPHAIGQEFNENEVPVCQGCKKHEAQFVCAGCGNQWYCSRECQVTAWDDHSEVCTDSDSNGFEVQDPNAQTSQADRPSRARVVPRRFSDYFMEAEGVED